MSETLHFAEHTLQEVALLFMGVIYTLRLLWIFNRFKAGRDRQPKTGNSSDSRGYLYSLPMIAMPWAMESYRKKPLMYVQFVLFHVGVALSILMSFLIPYSPAIMENKTLVLVFQTSFVLAILSGIFRLIRRITNPTMRAISSPDDYFSITLLIVWFVFAFLAAPNKDETYLLIYFYLTAFFLVYVPFSKISHYLYYPITRYYFGKTMGHRGVFPLPKEGKRRGTIVPYQIENAK